MATKFGQIALGRGVCEGKAAAPLGQKFKGSNPISENTMLTKFHSKLWTHQYDNIWEKCNNPSSIGVLYGMSSLIMVVPTAMVCS